MTKDSAAWLRSIPSLTGEAPALTLEALPDAPVDLFYEWLETALAAGVPEPLAATLATVDDDGIPDARTLILKNVDDLGWAVAGNATSAKGLQLATRPAAAINIWWQPLVRAVRVRGSVIQASREESAADYAARSAAARSDADPGDWTLWRVQAARVEFWQGSPDRRHLRIVFTRRGQVWTRQVSRTGDPG